jgi:phosphomethylpyrimidine synthase
MKSKKRKTLIMIAPAEAFEPSSSDPLPNSTRVYAEGKIHPQLRVPMREISLSDTKRLDGSL